MTSLAPASTLTPASVQDLQARVRGTVLQPGDAGYDTFRQGWNLSIQQRPAIIVVAASASDVAEAVRFARANRLGVAVQSTGHGVLCAADDALLVVTSQMTGISIDPEEQTAIIEAGAEWGPVLEQAQAFGLAPLLGSSPNVGVVGYSLGGGLGWLARKYGFASDSVLYYELVTADGRMLRASPTENSELFWGLHGAGTNFGIVTAVKMQLFPVAMVYAGNIMYPAALAREVFDRYRAWITDAPDELNSSISLMNFPPAPVVPEPMRGKSFVIVRGCYVGSVDEGAALFDVWNNWGQPVANTFRAMPFAEAPSISQDPLDPMPSVANGAWLGDLSDETVETLIQHAVAQNGPLPLVFAEVRHMGGAVARAERHVGAIGHHDGPFLLNLIGVAFTPEMHPAVEGYLEQVVTALESHLTGGLYLNFMEGDKARMRARDAYAPGALERMVALKAQYDPEDIFRFSYHIPLNASQP